MNHSTQCKWILWFTAGWQLTLYPSKTKASSSVPSSTSGLHPGLAHPTLMSPPVTASNSKYHLPVFTAYVLSTLKKRTLSMLSRSTTCPTGWKGQMQCQLVDCTIQNPLQQMNNGTINWTPVCTFHTLILLHRKLKACGRKNLLSGL